MGDYLALVRQYEPVLLFSKDGDGLEENFFPMNVADYVVDGLQLTRYGQQFVAAGAQAPRGPAWQFDRWERPVHWAKIRDVR